MTTDRGTPAPFDDPAAAPGGTGDRHDAVTSADLARLNHVRDGLTVRLTTWGLFSVVTGAVAVGYGRRTGRSWAVGLGRQFLVWGLVDVVVAGVGSAANRADSRDPRESARRLRRLLLVNAGLDVAYMGGALVMWRRGLRGDALGVVVQAAALFGLDAAHARMLTGSPEGTRPGGPGAA